MNKMIRAVSVLLMVALLAGCSDDQKDSVKDETPVSAEPEVIVAEEPVVEEVPEPVVVKPTFGGVLNIAMSPADTLNPLENKVANVTQVLNLIYEPLFRLDSTLAPVPVLVQDFEYSLEGKALTLVLKEGILFQDGTPLTSEDVSYTVDAIKDSEASPYKPLVMPIKRTSAADEWTITIYYDEPYAFALNDLTFPIVSKAYMKSKSYSNMVPVGTGPYAFVDYQEMQHMDLAAYDGWHGGSVYVEAIHAIAMNETTNMETLFDQHLIDVMNPSKFNWLKYSDKEDQRIESYATGNYDFIGFNMNKELFQDKELRKAFAYAIDKDEIIYNQFINHAIAVETPVIPGSWFKSEADMTYTYSPDIAISMLSSQLYSDGDGDGFFDEKDIVDETKFNTIELVMLVNGASSIRTSVAPIIEQYIEAIGFDVVVDIVDSSVYYERVATGDFDLLFGGWQMSSKPDYVALFSTLGTQNYFGYTSDEMDLTLKSTVSAYDSETVKQRVRDFEDIFIEDMPYISLYFLEGAVMSHDNVYGNLAPTAVSTYNTIDTLYLDLTGE